MLIAACRRAHGARARARERERANGRFFNADFTDSRFRRGIEEGEVEEGGGVDRVSLTRRFDGKLSPRGYRRCCICELNLVRNM